MLPERIMTTDYHTAGEPFRIVANPPVPLPGDSVADRRARAIADLDAQALRATLCSEPRGHADMYGGFIVPPDDAGAHLGVLFWHKDGFSTACGHGTIALGVWAVETGRVLAPATGSVEVLIDVPSGRVTARVHRVGGQIEAVDFVNVPSWHVASDVMVATSRGEVSVSVAFGGALYAALPASSVGLAVEPAHLADLIALSREIQAELEVSEHASHPSDPRLSGIYGVIWFDDLGGDADNLHQRNVTVFADGEVDRSACGSGTAARVATLVAQGQLSESGTLRHDSIVGTTFLGRAVGVRDGCVVPQVTGMAYRTGEHVFVVDSRDPLVPGFTLR